MNVSVQVFVDMKAAGLEPTPFAYSQMLRICEEMQNWQQAVAIFRKMEVRATSHKSVVTAISEFHIKFHTLI